MTLETRAAEVCTQLRGPSDLPPNAFTTDGCSMWPDSVWVECCVTHDIAYWCGGSARDRRRADEVFRACVADRRSAAMGRMMHLGVRMGGAPWWPTPWRWGYGWDGLRCYEPSERSVGAAGE